MKGGFFESTYRYGSARAVEVMNSKSANDFYWSLKCDFKEDACYIGIASIIQRSNSFLGAHDENAILFDLHFGTITKGSYVYRHSVISVDSKDEIHLKFQPKLKKFSIAIPQYRYKVVCQY